MNNWIENHEIYEEIRGRMNPKKKDLVDWAEVLKKFHLSL